jgi:hypothetical protein
MLGGGAGGRAFRPAPTFDEVWRPRSTLGRAQGLLLKLGNEADDAHAELRAWISGDAEAAPRPGAG